MWNCLTAWPMAICLLARPGLFFLGRGYYQNSHVALLSNLSLFRSLSLLHSQSRSTTFRFSVSSARSSLSFSLSRRSCHALFSYSPPAGNCLLDTAVSSWENGRQFPFRQSKHTREQAIYERMKENDKSYVCFLIYYQVIAVINHCLNLRLALSDQELNQNWLHQLDSKLLGQTTYLYLLYFAR